MNKDDFEGTLVLEKLSAIGKLDSFFASVDSNDFTHAKALMKRAGVDFNTIETVMQKMRDGDED